jgi:hypothetical protein
MVVVIVEFAKKLALWRCEVQAIVLNKQTKDPVY